MKKEIDQVITAGLDVGAETAKAVIVNDGKVRSWSVVRAGLDSRLSAEQALELAISKARICRKDIKRVAATGMGRNAITFADFTVPEITAEARGAAFLFPSARTVVAIGAEEVRVIRLDSLGKAQGFVKNDKCAAGVGAFVQAMARALEVNVEDMGTISLRSLQDIAMNLTCVVFAESEVVSLIHSHCSKEDIAAAIHEAIAIRTVSMVKRLGIEKDIAFIGGVARNLGVVDRLKKHLGTDVLIPKDPEIVGALGATLITP